MVKSSLISSCPSYSPCPQNQGHYSLPQTQKCMQKHNHQNTNQMPNFSVTSCPSYNFYEVMVKQHADCVLNRMHIYD